MSVYSACGFFCKCVLYGDKATCILNKYNSNNNQWLLRGCRRYSGCVAVCKQETNKINSKQETNLFFTILFVNKIQCQLQALWWSYKRRHNMMHIEIAKYICASTHWFSPHKHQMCKHTWKWLGDREGEWGEWVAPEEGSLRYLKYSIWTLEQTSRLSCSLYKWMINAYTHLRVVAIMCWCLQTWGQFTMSTASFKINVHKYLFSPPQWKCVITKHKCT